MSRFLPAFLAVNLFAQSGPAPARFEVASIKPAEPLTAAGFASPTFHRGLRIEPGRVDMRFMPLRELIETAYNMDRYRISGPAWLTRPEPFEARIFDIQAKMPAGSTKEQVRVMVQGLLTDRFGLTVHRETKEVAVLALVIADKGSKLMEAASGNCGGTGPPAGRKPAQDYDMGVDGEHFQVFSGDKTSLVIHAGPDGATRVTTENAAGGMSHYEDSRLTMDVLANRLTHLCGAIVVDMTGLKGRYAAVYDLPKIGTAPSDAIGRVESSLAKLGLKLEKRKASVEFLVVDHVEKEPTAN